MANTAVATPLTAAELFGIFKTRIALMIALSALGGTAISPGATPPSWQIALTALAVFLAAASAGAFNQWAESDLEIGRAHV